MSIPLTFTLPGAAGETKAAASAVSFLPPSPQPPIQRARLRTDDDGDRADDARSTFKDTLAKARAKPSGTEPPAAREDDRAAGSEKKSQTSSKPAKSGRGSKTTKGAKRP